MSHVVPQKIYGLVFATLICMTLITVDVAFYNFGWLNIYLAMIIATFKATIVVMYFMHVKFSPRLTWLFAVAGLFWMVILLVLMLADYMAR
ncbi:MAG: cytochrome C oxidase subunit IV family protein [Ignavibacteria bacterium]|nr:cytochrome C oxidase subunit IV family protein [Ignavibacteria bacterium]